MIYETPRLGEEEEVAIGAVMNLRQQLRRLVNDEQRRWVGGLRRIAFAKNVQGSNSIEGYNASLEDVMAAVENEDASDVDVETVHALQGYRDAMTYVLQLADESEVVVNGELLKALHFMMIKYDLSKHPGRFRKKPIFVKRNEDGATVYEGPDWENVPTLIAGLLADVRDRDGDVLVRAAMAHLNLVMIHPFSDGNGRMARCLQTLVLTREKIVAPVFSSIEEYLGGNTQAYYDVLATVGQGAWSPRNDARSWIRFCLNAHYQCAQTQLWRVTEAEMLWDTCESLAKKAGLSARVLGPLSDAARGLRLRNASYRTVATESYGEEIDVQTASRDLRALVAAGLLMPKGQTRGRTYVRTPEVQAAFDEIQASKPAIDLLDLFSSASQKRYRNAR